MLFSFFKKNIISKKYIVLVIDTSAVTLSIIEKFDQNNEHVHYVHRLSLEMDKIIEPSNLLRFLNKKTAILFETLQKNKIFSTLKQHAQVIVLVGSPWHIGWNDRIEIKRDSNFRINHEFIDSALKDSFTNSHKDLFITSVCVSGYLLNGYNVPNPFGKITNSIELITYINSVPKVFVDLIQKTIKTTFPYNDLVFLSFNNSLNAALQLVYGVKDSLLVIPENETTQIILTKNGLIVAEATIPFGGATLARSLFGARSSSIKESLGKTKRFIAGHLDVPELEQIGLGLENQKKNFLNNFRDVLWKLNDTLLLPETLYVIGKNIGSHFVFEWIKTEEYTNKTFTTEGFKINNLKGDDLLTFFNKNKVSGKKNVPIAVALGALTVHLSK